MTPRQKTLTRHGQPTTEGEAGEAGIVDHLSFVVMPAWPDRCVYERPALSGSRLHNAVLMKPCDSRPDCLAPPRPSTIDIWAAGLTLKSPMSRTMLALSLVVAGSGRRCVLPRGDNAPRRQGRRGEERLSRSAMSHRRASEAIRTTPPPSANSLCGVLSSRRKECLREVEAGVPDRSEEVGVARACSGRTLCRVRRRSERRDLVDKSNQEGRG